MRKITPTVFAMMMAVSILSVKAGNTTNGTTHQKPLLKHEWTINPFDYQVFIENRGQFDTAIQGKDQVLFSAKFGAVTAYFTNHGIVYRYNEIIQSGQGDPDERPLAVIRTHYLKALWEGSNPNVTVTAEEQHSNYYTYPVSTNRSIKVNVYGKIVYHNIYPDIDVEYTFPKGKEGFKYALIVHPGADLSKVKIAYDGAKNLELSGNGNMLVNSESLGVLTDHAPVSFYQEDKQPVQSGFKMKGLEESFFTQEASASKTIVIDPWVTDPILSNAGYDRAYDLDYDTNGNVYVYGGYSYYELSKISPTGVLLWTFVATSFASPWIYYGDFSCDRPSGSCYLVEGFNSSGARVLKVDNGGNLGGTFPGDPSMLEMWRAASNNCNRTIVIGGGGTNSPAPYNAFILDTNLNKISAINTSNAPDPGHDVVLEAIDPNGQFCYMAVPLSTFGPSPGNEIIKSPLPSLTPNNWVTATDSFAFNEVGQPNYVIPLPFGSTLANGMNGMAASPHNLYAYNGDTLRQYDKATGVFKRVLRVNGGNTLYSWGGLDADVLERAYVGYKDSILIFDSTLTFVSGLQMQNTVFDVVINPPSKAYACGIGFVSSFAIPHIKLISTTAGAPSSCAACDGKASVINMLGGLPPYTYTWSNGETGQTDTLLCAGLYTVTVKDASCPPLIDTAILTITSTPGYGANLVDTNPSGCTNSKGNITSFVVGGTGPYTYQWSNGATTAKDTGLVAGTYTLTITDANGCKFVTLTGLVNPVPVPVTAFPIKDSICAGGSLNLTASGVSTYSWSPPAGLSCLNCPNPTATPTVNTTYTVTGTDSNGCTSTATVQIQVNQKPIVTINPPTDTICQGNSANLNASGATSYAWTPSATLSCPFCSSTTATPTVTTIYTLVGTDSHGCTDTTKIQIVVTPKPSGSITVVPASDTICKGDSALLIGSGGTSYLWTNHGSTGDSIYVKDTVTTTEYVQITKNGCTVGINKKIVVINGTTSIKLLKDSICTNDSSRIVVSGGTSYKWLPPLNSSNDTVWVKGNANTTFSVVVSSKCGPNDTLKTTLHVVPAPHIVFTGNTVICKGGSANWNVSGGTAYAWSPSTGLSCNNCANPTASPTVTTTYQLTVSNGKCSSDTTIKMTVAPPLNPKITAAPQCICKGGTTTLTAKGGGSYLWNTGSNDSVITVSPTHDSTFYVVVDKICKDTAKTTICVDVPSFIVCCDTSIQINGSATLHAFGSATMTYVWAPPTGLSCTTCANPVASPTVTTTYTVTCTDSAGCSTERLVTIYLECDDFTVPNIFTPNNDGINDDFEIIIPNYATYSIKVYDRWGKEVYSSTDPKVYWNGKINGTQNTVSDGVYYYVIDATCGDNTYKKKGFVQVLSTK